MTCAGCVKTLERSLIGVPGALEARVNLAERSARVVVEKGAVGRADLERAVVEAGYRIARTDAHPWADLRREGLRLAVALALAACLPLVHTKAVAALLVAAAVLGPGSVHLAGAWRAVARRRTADMHVLVTLGLLAGSIHMAIGGGHAMPVLLVAFLALGRTLEALVRGRAQNALRALASLMPEKAHLLKDGILSDVPLDEVRILDRVEVRPGERFPLDGFIEEGRCLADLSPVTGESLPRVREPGDRVAAGTLCLDARVLLRVDRVVGDSFLAEMGRMVREAQADRAPSRRLADSAAALLVPLVLAVAGAAGTWWWIHSGPMEALFRVTAVLVVACPCALGLASPMAIVAGSAALMRNGLLVRRAGALEEAANLDTVMLDKTGTLTKGTLSVTRISPAEGCGLADLLAAGAAPRSAHPAAAALRRRAGREGITPIDVSSTRERAGLGTLSECDGGPLLVGSPALLFEEGVDVAEAPEGSADESWVGVARGGRLMGWLALGDTLRPGAREAVGRLAALGLRVTVCSGDTPQRAEDAAAAVGAAQGRGGMSPEDKAEAVRTAGRVLFAGDGLNDAPALAAATVGVAVAEGTDVAREAGHVLLVGGDPGALATLVVTGRRVRTVIRQNLAWALLYNAFLLPAAAGVGPWNPGPAAAGLLMGLSSVTVCLNSLRLLRSRA